MMRFSMSVSLALDVRNVSIADEFVSSNIKRVVMKANKKTLAESNGC